MEKLTVNVVEYSSKVSKLGLKRYWNSLCYLPAENVKKFLETLQNIFER